MCFCAYAAGQPSLNEQRRLWLCCACEQGLHYDANHNSLTVIQGKKRVFLFDPSQTPKLSAVVQRQAARDERDDEPERFTPTNPA